MYQTLNAFFFCSGVIYDGNDLHYIEPDHKSENSSHFLFRASDLKPQNLTCGKIFI